ncbi:MAG: hypothetical protein ACYSU0_19280 [Planctomycetota bacterium]|jgi:hypothetical protein
MAPEASREQQPLNASDSGKKRPWWDYLLWPNMWIAVAALVAVSGMVCMVLSMITNARWLLRLGWWLTVPLWVLGLALAVAAVVSVVWENRRTRKRRRGRPGPRAQDSPREPRNPDAGR